MNLQETWLELAHRIDVVVIKTNGGLLAVGSLQFQGKTSLFCFSLLTFWHRNFTFNSNKSPTLCNNFSVYYPDVCLQLNMFREFSRPSSGAQWLQWQPLVLPSYRGDSRAVFVVRPAGRPDHEHSTTITTIRKWNQRLPLQSLSSWWWAGKRPKLVEL